MNNNFYSIFYIWYKTKYVTNNSKSLSIYAKYMFLFIVLASLIRLKECHIIILKFFKIRSKLACLEKGFRNTFSYFFFFIFFYWKYFLYKPQTTFEKPLFYYSKTFTIFVGKVYNILKTWTNNQNIKEL